MGKKKQPQIEDNAASGPAAREPASAAQIGGLIVLAALVILSTIVVLFKGTDLPPTARQLTMLFAAVFVTILLFFGASTGAFNLNTPSVTIRLTGAAAVGAAFYFLLYFFAPKPEYRAAGIYLDHAGQPLSRDFRATIRLSGIDPIIRRGEAGVLHFQLPSHIDQLESVSIEECAGYRMSDRQKWPAKLENGNLHIAMMRTRDSPPSPPPPEHYVMDRPSEAELKTPPRVKPDAVRFQYKNLTDSDMQLFLFSFSRPSDGDHPLWPNSPWLGGWPFPAKDEFVHFQEFKTGNGWFALFVVSEGKVSQAGDHVFPLRNKVSGNKNLFNLFEHRTTSLVVKETGKNDSPYEAFVTWED